MLSKAYHYIIRRPFAVMLLESFPKWGNAKTFTPMSYLSPLFDYCVISSLGPAVTPASTKLIDWLTATRCSWL